MSFSLNTYHLKPKEKTDSAVIILHGYGADGNDMLPIIARWHNQLPHTFFVVPDAPFACEVNPTGKQWFSLQPFAIDHITKQANRHQHIMHTIIEETLRHTQLPAQRLILSGFSQGGMLALHVGLTYTPSVAAVIGYSCALTLLEQDDVNSKPPVLLIHGEQDDVVNYTLMQQSATRLRQLGIETTTLSRPQLAHGIDALGITTAVQFIRKCLTNNPSLP